MKKLHLLGAVCAVLFTVITVSAHASLVGRLPLTPGGTDYQAAYDNVLDITWTTNAGLSGLGNWDNRVGWADGLDTANYLGVDGWRLASMSVSAGLPTGTSTNPVDCDSASQSACEDNELGYMFYINMSGILGDNLTGDQTVGEITLTDVQSFYLSGTEYDSSNAWVLDFRSGHQCYLTSSTCLTISSLYGWAVRDGDVGAVPVPAAVWLFGSGLLGLVGMARRKKTA